MVKADTAESKEERKSGAQRKREEDKKHMRSFSLNHEHMRLLDDPRITNASKFLRFLVDSFIESAKNDPDLIDKVSAQIYEDKDRFVSNQTQ